MALTNEQRQVLTQAFEAYTERRKDVTFAWGALPDLDLILVADKPLRDRKVVVYVDDGGEDLQEVEIEMRIL